MSNPHHEAFMEQLVNEAYTELRLQNPQLDPEISQADDDELYIMACNLAKKRWEFDYD